jgi:transcriptional regulator with XRE-family HTH domain
MSFGENLKKFREEKQLGVNQLALKSGVSAAQISRFENGKRKTPHVDTAKKLAKALSIPLPLLIDETIPYDEWDYDENQRRVANQIKDMTEEEITDVLEYIAFVKQKNKKR